MKNKTKRNCLFLLIAVLTFSCTTNSKGTVLNDSIPFEQSSRIFFFSFIPKIFNGSPTGMNWFQRLVTIPSGFVYFIGDIDYYLGDLRFQAKDAQFSYNFESGKEYTAFVSFEHDNENKVQLWGVAFYEGIHTTSITLTEDNFIEWIPFNPPVFSQTFWDSLFRK